MVGRRQKVEDRRLEHHAEGAASVLTLIATAIAYGVVN